MIRHLVTLLMSLVVLVLYQSSAEATLNVRVLDTTVPVGSSGTIDVEISGTSDLVASFSLELRISPIGAVGSSLQFTNPQTVSYRNDTRYVFVGDSGNLIGNVDPRLVSNTTLQNDTFVDNDSTNSLANVMVTTPRLLARLNLSSVLPFGTDPSTVLGDKFLVSVVQTPNTTEFLNSVGANVPFIAFGGTASLGATAVPEPSSVGLVVVGLAAAAYQRRRRTNPS
jgi:hypothetical protein